MGLPPWHGSFQDDRLPAAPESSAKSPTGSFPSQEEKQCPHPGVCDEGDNSAAAATAEEIGPARMEQRGSVICAPDDSDNEEDAHGDPALTRQLLELSKTFYGTFECKQLAVYLEIAQGGRIVSSFQSINPRMAPQDMAYDIMMAWRREKGVTATNEELRYVLRHKMKKVDAVEQVWPVGAISGDPNLTSALTKNRRREAAGHALSLAGTVPEATIMDIALSGEFSSEFSCEKLAVFLEISQGSQFVLDSNPHASNCEKAYDVMMEWKREKGSAATGERLCDVLRNELKTEGLALQLEQVFHRSQD